MKGLRTGLVFFVVVVVGIGIYDLVSGFAARGTTPFDGIFSSTTTVVGYIGSEKANFLANPDVQRILADDYGLELDARRAGSFEMLELAHDGIDFLWPSSQVALEKYRTDVGPPLADEIVFNSPIVLYAWDDVERALTAEELLRREDGVSRAPLAPLLEAMLEGVGWSDLGVPQVFGTFTITSTDPLSSNSGNMYMGLVANTLAGRVVDERELQRVLPDVVEVFRLQGQMEHSTGTLFERFLDLGIAQYPLIVGYESQYIELARENPEVWSAIGERISLIYPVPTVWSSHPMIALTEQGRALIEALRDERLRDIAWEVHGFRGGVADARNDPTRLGVKNVADEVTQVIQMPRPEVVFSMMDALEPNR